jgi:hypothetical protein
VAHLAGGGAGWAVYNETPHRNLDALRPSFLVLQPLSRNDGMFPAALDALFARLLATREHAAAVWHAATIFQGAYPIPASIPRTAAMRRSARWPRPACRSMTAHR